MRRWLLIALALVLALAGAWGLATSRSLAPNDEEIDAASERRLERVLRDARDQEPTRP